MVVFQTQSRTPEGLPLASHVIITMKKALWCPSLSSCTNRGDDTYGKLDASRWFWTPRRTAESGRYISMAVLILLTVTVKSRGITHEFAAPYSAYTLMCTNLHFVMIFCSSVFCCVRLGLILVPSHDDHDFCCVRHGLLFSTRFSPFTLNEAEARIILR